MAGGIGNVVGTIIGGVRSSVIRTCIALLRVSSYWETIVTGAVVLIAVLIDAVKGNPVIKAKIKRIFQGRHEANKNIQGIHTGDIYSEG